jgi:hypothetical protein
MSLQGRGWPWRSVLPWAGMAAVAGGMVAGAWAVTAPGAALAPPPDTGSGAAVAAGIPADMEPAAGPAGVSDAGRQAQQQAGARPGPTLGCEQCHGELELLRQQAGSLNRARELLVPHHIVAASAHGAMSCAECHAGFARYPHDDRAAQTRSCESCHADATDHWRRGSHFTADDQVGCVQCHGAHDIRTVEELRSEAGTARANEPCIGCHQTARLEPHSPHAEAVQCAACHGPHDVRPVHDPESWMAPARQRQTCGTCHDSIAAVSTRDIHGDEDLRRAHLAGRAASSESVTCTSCHIGHEMIATDDPRFSVVSTERCAACHEHAARTFFGSYHGKATALGSRVAATCADCHGAHDIFPDGMAASRVAQANLVETCSACHPYARPAFVLYDAHPDPFNRARNPWIFYSFWMMNGLLVFVLLVFGTHTILWWVRLWLDKRRGIIHGPGQGGH